MADLGHRKSRANWATKDNFPVQGLHVPKNPLHKGKFNGSADNLSISNHMPQIAESYKFQHSQTSFQTFDDGMSIAPSLTPSVAKRRFSVKLDSHDLNFPTGGIPALPTNASSLIKDAKYGTGHNINNNNNNDHNKSFNSPLDEKNVPLASATLASDLSNPKFDADKYVKNHLRNANASNIDDFANRLNDLNIENDNDVKNMINQSLVQVLQVSNGISSTEQEIKLLKISVNKLNEILTQQVEEAQEIIDSENTDSGSSATGQRSLRANRNSVLRLEKKWATNLNKLFKDVEGAQKFISAIPGRHVVAESKRWGELNAVTWKPIRPAHLIILNDHVLIATRKKTGSGEKKRTVATQCWPIREVQLTAVKQEPNGYVISLKINGLTFLYQTDKIEDFNIIQEGFRTAKDEANNLLENEKLKQKELQNSLSRLSATQERLTRNSEILHDLTSSIHNRSRSLDAKEKKLADVLNSLDADIMNLEIHIGHHKYEECVGYIKNLNETIDELMKNQSLPKNDSDLNGSNGLITSGVTNNTDSSTKILIQVKKMKIQSLSDALVHSLTQEIQNPRTPDHSIVEIMELFKILEFEDKGRAIFLDSKYHQILALVREIKFDGNISSYIIQLSTITFALLKSTALLYLQCFKNTKDKIHLVTWINERVSEHMVQVDRQFTNIDKKSEMFISSTKIIRSQASKLKEIGINVDFLLEF
ncbi:hypothetical protein BVG19_g2112 [[Candida] boidinii]|nr:hypothetical protein BVG19_g2112 [[Candida] boidinii]OWB51771.1 hypothetical protein B5S27_g3339 [[Candida] boidinii]